MKLQQIKLEGNTFLQDNLIHNNLNKSSNLRIIGSILHDYYTCIEKIFRKIAKEVDGELPSGSAWHMNLLDRMELSIESIRINVICNKTKVILSDYLRFRHIFRNVYGFQLDWDKLKHLVENLEENTLLFQKDISDFIIFLKKLEKEINS